MHADLSLLQNVGIMRDVDGVYRCKHFIIEELVYPEIFVQLGEELCWRFLDSRICWTMDALREYYDKPIYANNWKWGGDKKLRGLRPFNSTIGATYSMHKFGGAIDFVIKDISHEQFVDDVKTNKDEPAFKYITAIEDFSGMTWNHVDVRNVKRVMVFDNK